MERIELNAKTNMSAMNGIAEAGELIAKAISLGQKAIAICDWDTVLAYPYIARAMKALKRAKDKNGDQLDFKAIYGLEVFVRDDMVPNKGKADNPCYSVVLLLKSWGDENAIYRLISEAEAVDNNTLVVLKSELEKYRKYFLIGSSGDLGEIWQALEFDDDDDTIAQKMAFYDYVEIVPATYLQHWIIDEIHTCHYIKEIQYRQKRMLTIAKRLGKPVVATNHPTLVTQEDFNAWKMLVKYWHAGKGDAEYPLFLLSAEEMQEQLSYLNAKTAHEVVVVNPHLIANKCGNFEPPIMGKQYPHNHKMERELTERIKIAAKKVYGDKLTQAIKDRISEEMQLLHDQELITIFAVAVKLCDFSREQGYPVSVSWTLGNLVIAYLTGMVAEDPLQYNLHLEGYFGVNKDKMAGVTLAFAPEIYPEIKEKLIACFPNGQLLRGSYVITLFPTNYYTPDTAMPKEIWEKLCCVREKWGRSFTGRIIIPDKSTLYRYLPTHKRFDSNGNICAELCTGIEKRELDGSYFTIYLSTYDLVSMIKKLHILTGIDWQDIDIHDKALLREAYLDDGKGIHELQASGTQELLKLFKPKTFSGLLKICALQHAAYGWEKQKPYFEKGDITIDNIISTRDDVMDLCLEHGLDTKQAFNIMETVRKSKCLSEKQITLLKGHALPEWFISCCSGDKQIQYLSTRADCLNALRLSLITLWYKVHYPKCFYQAYFETYAE